MATGKKVGAIERYSYNGNMYVKQVDPDGTDLSSPDTWKLISYVKGVKYSSQQAKTKIADDTGKTVKSLYDEKEVMLTGNFLQNDKDLQDFIEAADGKYYAIWLDCGIYDGKYKEIVMPLCQFSPNWEEERGVIEHAFEAEALAAPAEITIAALDGQPDEAHTTTDVVISAGEFRTVVETTVS